MKNFKRAPKNLFKKFGDYFPYSTVDVIIRDDKSFLLAKRTIEPYRNYWNFVGGVIFKTEKLHETVKRVAKEEAGLEVKIEKFLGVYENPVIVRHDLSHVFMVTISKGKIKLDFQSNEIKFFKVPPKKIVPYQREMYSDAKSYLIQKK